jgi:hypothetical protein
MTAVSIGSVMRRRAALVAAAAVAALTSLALASNAAAAELIYWDNYAETGHPSNDSVSYANIDGGGGGPLNLGGLGLVRPEGMAIDTAGGRLFVASSGETEYDPETETNKVVVPGQILAVNLDGSGASPFSVPGAPVDEPEGIVVDPTTGLVIWANTGTGSSKGSIAWAKLDGSAGGTLNTSGATLRFPDRIGLDPASGRVFWANVPEALEPVVLSYAYLNNTGGGDLDTTGAPEILSQTGFAVDSAASRLYWLSSPATRVSYASLSGGGGGEISLAGATVNEPYGLAIDPSLGKLYWGNYGNHIVRTGAIGFSSLSGVGGGITITTSPVNGAQDPQVLKSPAGNGAPVLTRANGSRAVLACTAGTWAADDAGGFVYQAPTTYAYQWARNGDPIARATAAAYTAKAAGKYTCTVTAANQAGSAAQVSAALKLKAAKLSLKTKKKAKAKPGKLATFKLKVVNQGDVKSSSAKLCVRLSGPAKKALKRPRCKQLGKLAGARKRKAKLTIKVQPNADPGAYQVTFQVKRARGRAVKARVIVVG